MRESAILFEARNYWVCKTKTGYTVFLQGVTHSVEDSTYEDISLAIARCKYLAKLFER